MALRLLTAEGKVTDSDEARRWVEQHTSSGAGQGADCAAFWLDIIEPDQGAIDWLASYFRFHPLTIEDLRSPNERGKLEVYDNYLFLIVHSAHVEGLGNGQTHNTDGPSGHNPQRPPRRDPLHPHWQHPAKEGNDGSRQGGGDSGICALDSHELHAYLSKSYLITVHDPQMLPVEKVWKNIEAQAAEGEVPTLQHGVDYVLYKILDSTADSFFDALETTAEQIDSLEDTVLGKPDPELLKDVFIVKRNLMTLRRVVTPMREAVGILGTPGSPFVHDENERYLRDVHSLLVAVYELADTQRDATSGVLDTYLSSVNNNLSVVVKRLTLFATIFMPLSFIVGFGGMNFVKFIPYDSPVAFWVVIAALIVTPILMLIWFWRSRWF